MAMLTRSKINRRIVIKAGLHRLELVLELLQGAAARMGPRRLQIAPRSRMTNWFSLENIVALIAGFLVACSSHLPEEICGATLLGLLCVATSPPPPPS